MEGEASAVTQKRALRSGLEAGDARARGRPLDALILDLEDGVPPAVKDEARENLVEAAGSGKFPPSRSWMVRVNHPDSGWFEQDLEQIERLAPAGVVLPKAEDPEQVAELAERFSRHGSETCLMIETVHGVGSVRDLAGADPNVAMLLFGSADFRLSMGARPDPERRWERHALHEILLAARLHGCIAIDSVYFHFRDDIGLAEHARVARDLGFDGKSCIHPGQVKVIHEAFSPTRQEVGWAEAVLSEWEAKDGAAHGTIVVNGEMIEALHLTVARRILDRRTD
jgi:citrate lyase subunit beta/citryl-CoA lyase